MLRCDLLADPQVFALEHALFDQRPAARPVLGLAGALGGNQHHVIPVGHVGCDRVHRHDRARSRDARRRRSTGNSMKLGVASRRRSGARQILGRVEQRAARGERADVMAGRLGDRGRVEEEPIDRVAVQHANVIAVEERLDDELPVAAAGRASRASTITCRSRPSAATSDRAAPRYAPTLGAEPDQAVALDDRERAQAARVAVDTGETSPRCGTWISAPARS